MSIPSVNPFDWIRIGETDAVVCTLRDYGELEVVYLRRNRAINEDVRWNGDGWEFVENGPSGGYADKKDRLRPFVTQLRRKRRKGLNRGGGTGANQYAASTNEEPAANRPPTLADAGIDKKLSSRAQKLVPTRNRVTSQL